MCPCAVVIVHIRKEHMAQVSFAEDDDMIKTFPSDRANQSFCMSILPWRLGAVGRSRMPMARSGFVARMCRISLGVLKGIDDRRFQPGALSCFSNIIPRDAVIFPGKGIG